MGNGSPTAFQLWAILSTLFFIFLLFHLWRYDRFKCVKWNSGRQPGAFKRVMTYAYLASVPSLMVFSVAITALKYQEGMRWGFIVIPFTGQVTPKPMLLWSPNHRRWVLPLYFVFSIGWSLELVTHLEELAFWLFLLNQSASQREWFRSWEYKTWCIGSMIAILGMPITTLSARRDLDLCLAWTFLVGSTAGTTTTLLFLYVIWQFPVFLKVVKADDPTPDVVLRLTTFYHLNLVRVVFRFFFTVPLLILAVDAVQRRYVVLQNEFLSDFFLMLAAIGCLVSSAITLLIFFPLSNISDKAAETRPQSTALSTVPRYFHHCHQCSSPAKTQVHGCPCSACGRTSFGYPHTPQDGPEIVEREDVSHPTTMARIRHPDAPRDDNSIQDEPYVVNRQEKGTASGPQTRALEEANTTPSPSNVHPYVMNFTSPIDLHDGQGEPIPSI